MENKPENSAEQIDEMKKTIKGLQRKLGAIAEQEAASLLLESGPTQPQLDNLMFQAISRRDEKILIMALKKGANPNAVREGSACTPLTDDIALRHFPAAVRILLSYKADPNQPDRLGRLPLAVALHMKDQGFYSQLLKAGANADAVIDRNQQNTVLHIAAMSRKPDLVWLARDFNLNAMNARGMTPTMLAVRAGDAATVTELIRAGADLSARNYNGHTALDLARQDRKQDIVKLLEDALRELKEKKTQERIATLESEVAELKSLLKKPAPPAP